MNREASSESGKVAIVTGASRGIGAAIAARLARDGFSVVVNYAGSQAPAEALVRKIEAAGGRALAARADVADPAAVASMFEAAAAAFGGVDVLVNNAGIMKLAKLADSDDALFDSQAVAPGPTATDLFLDGKSPFSSAPTAHGSTARSCVPTAE